jgi:trk system potassium uptake protein TrkH
MLIPLVPVFIYREFALFKVFFIPSMLSLATGLLLRRFVQPGTARYLQSLLVCGMAWVVLSVFASVPFWLGTHMSFLDAYFETVSGFTTTGITLFTHIESLQKSILFWRGFIQWLGGLGILTLFLAITIGSDNTYFRLFSAESHKIEASRPSPSIYKTVVILWGIYAMFTLLEVLVLHILGVGLFDAVCHSFTTLSTGGFSTFDASIDHFHKTGYANYRAIEYVMTFFMFLGGVNFLLHYKVLTGNFGDVRRNPEFRWFVTIILVTTLVIMVDHYRRSSGSSAIPLEAVFRNSIFTVVSLLTTTGYGTTDINTPFFSAMSKQVFLVLMLIGGCVGSTGGGIKVFRVMILLKAFTLQIIKARLPRKAVTGIVIDNTIIPAKEFKRLTGLFSGWLLLILIGGLVTAFFTNLGSFESISGMFSAVGNIGPCYITVQQMSELPAMVKLTYIFGMLAGRLEILPVLLIFNIKAWKRD